jgi:hypothetical protein
MTARWHDQDFVTTLDSNTRRASGIVQPPQIRSISKKSARRSVQ